MRFRYISAIVLVSVMFMTGCSVVEKAKSPSKNKVTATVSQPQESAVNQTVEKASTPKGTTPAATVKEEVKPASASPKDYEKLDGEWAIMKVYGEKIVADEHPVIYFEASTHRFYGNNGCNTINGTFTLPNHSKMKMSNIAATTMLCQNAPFEYKVNQILGEVAEYELSTKGQDSYLFLKSNKGVTIATLHRSDNAFIDGAWQVTAINGDRMTVNENMSLVIDIPEGRVHGNAGCNMVNGKVIVDSEVTSSIQFSSLMTSRMTCPDQSKETALLVALENVTSWKKDGSTHAVLTDGSGKELVKLRKISREELGL